MSRATGSPCLIGLAGCSMREPEQCGGIMKIMKKRTVLAVLFVLGQGVSIASAASGNTSGAPALALAGVMASHSSVLASFDRRAMARLFGGNSGISSGGAFLMPHRS